MINEQARFTFYKVYNFFIKLIRQCRASKAPAKPAVLLDKACTYIICCVDHNCPAACIAVHSRL